VLKCQLDHTCFQSANLDVIVYASPTQKQVVHWSNHYRTSLEFVKTLSETVGAHHCALHLSNSNWSNTNLDDDDGQSSATSELHTPHWRWQESSAVPTTDAQRYLNAPGWGVAISPQLIVDMTCKFCASRSDTLTSIFPFAEWEQS